MSILFCDWTLGFLSLYLFAGHSVICRSKPLPVWIISYLLKSLSWSWDFSAKDGSWWFPWGTNFLSFLSRYTVRLTFWEITMPLFRMHSTIFSNSSALGGQIARPKCALRTQRANHFAAGWFIRGESWKKVCVYVCVCLLKKLSAVCDSFSQHSHFLGTLCCARHGNFLHRKIWSFSRPFSHSEWFSTDCWVHMNK